MRNGILILAFFGVVWSTSPIFAQESSPHRPESNAPQGFYIGLNAGIAGSLFSYKEETRSITEDPIGGGLGGLRIGYAFSSKFAFGVEGFNFRRTKDQDQDWDLRTYFATLSYRPRGGGLFMKGGLGFGDGSFTHPDSGDQLSLDEEFAWLCSVGYDFRLSEDFTLGLSMVSSTMNAGGVSGYEKDRVGSAGLTLQLTWYP